MRTQLIANLCQDRPNFFAAGCPEGGISAIEITAQRVAPVLGDGGSFLPLVDAGVSFIRSTGQSPIAHQVLVRSEVDSLAHRRLSYWQRTAPAGGLPEATAVVTTGSKLVHIGILKLGTFDQLRQGSAPSQWVDRLFIVETGPLDPQQALDTFVDRADFHSKTFIARDLVPTLIDVMAKYGCCVVRPWIESDATLEIIGPPAVILALWAARGTTE